MPHRFEVVGDPMQAGAGASQMAVGVVATLSELPAPKGPPLWAFVAAMGLLITEYVAARVKATRYTHAYGVGVGHAKAE